MLRKTKSRFFSGKHLKPTLLAFALLFSVNALMAQQKYDYAMVTFSPTQQIVVVSINGMTAEKIVVSRQEIVNVYLDANPALKHVNVLEDDGWELFDTGSFGVGGGTAYIFYLRKKEQ